MDHQFSDSERADRAEDVDDLAAAYLKSRAVHRKVLMICAVAGLVGVAILAYVILIRAQVSLAGASGLGNL